MKSVDLKDKHLNQRLARVLSDLGDRPTACIPAACGGHGESIAACRLFDHEHVTYEKGLEPHDALTLERIAEQLVVLLVQDTTEIDVTRPHQQMAGAGSLDTSARRRPKTRRKATATRRDGSARPSRTLPCCLRKKSRFALASQKLPARIVAAASRARIPWRKWKCERPASRFIRPSDPIGGCLW